MKSSWLALLTLLGSPVASAEILRTGGVDLEYRISGEGEPLLLVHGFGSCIDHSWGAVIPALSRSWRVIAVHQRGHGASTNPSDRFTHAESAADIARLLDALGVQRVRAIGYSSGGMVLIHLALRDPGRISDLVLIGATPRFEEPARRIMRAVAEEGLPPQVREQFVRCASQGPAQAEALERQFGAFKDSRSDMAFSAADLGAIRARTLIVHGDRDEFFPVGIPVEMYRSIPDASLWIVPGGDHSPTAGAPVEHFLSTVSDFLGAGRAAGEGIEPPRAQPDPR